MNYKGIEKIVSVNLNDIQQLAIYSLGFECENVEEYLDSLDEYMIENKKHKLYNLYEKVANSSFGKVLLKEMIKLMVIETTKIDDENEELLKNQQKERMDKIINLLEVNKIEVENRKKTFGKRRIA